MICLGTARVDDRASYTLALELSKRIKDDELQLKSHWGLVNARVEQEKNCTAALEIATKIGDKAKQIDCIERLSWCALTENKYDNARNLLSRGVRICGSNDDLKRKLSRPLRVVGIEDSENYKAGLRIAETNGDVSMQVLCLLGMYHCQVDKFGKYALSAIEKARKRAASNKRLRDQVEEVVLPFMNNIDSIRETKIRRFE